MRACVQRVREASVTVAGEVVGRIERGLLVLLGVGRQDTLRDVEFLVDKIIGLRVFDDAEGKMNLALADVGGRLLVVSQFTLWGDCRKGRRPSYAEAAGLELAEQLYNEFVRLARTRGVLVETGRFRADMQVALVNDGPVTLWIDHQVGS